MKNLLMTILMMVITLPTNIIAYANPLVTNLVTPVSYYVDHVRQLHELANNLVKYNRASVIGTSGIGKTQLVRMYAYENKDKYNLIWFIDCNLNLNQEFLKLAKAINEEANKQLIPENLSKVKKEVMNYLEPKNNWLLVFDNNKINGNDKIKEFIDLQINGHMVFVSQDLHGLPYTIKVKGFTQKDSTELAKSILQDNQEEEINFLIDEFKGYPILIVQGAEILANVRGLSFAKYRKMISDTSDKVRLNVELCMQELPASSNELLKKIALINNQRFSKKFLTMITNSKETLDDDIYQLSRFALISNINTNNVDKDNPLFDMHDVVAATIQKINGNEQNKKYLEEAINLLSESFPKGLTKRHIIRVSPTINENLQIMLKNAEKFDIDIYKNLELRLELFGTSLNIGNYETSKVMLQWFEEKDQHQEFQLNKMTNHQKYVYAYYTNVVGYYNVVVLANPVKALEYYTKAREIASSVDGYEYMKFNINYQLFSVLLSLGQIENAEKAIKEVLNIYETGVKNNTIDKSEIYYLYGGRTRLFLAQGKYQQALEQINSCIEVFTEVIKQYKLKPTDNFLGAAYQLKIEILNNLKRYDEAYALAEWFYKTHKSYFPPEHETIANIYTKMAVAQYGQKKYQAALDNANKAVLMFIRVRNIDPEKIQFSKDIQLAKALMVKADCLSALGTAEESLATYEKAEAIHNNVYVGHLDSSISLRHILFEGTKTACKKPSELNKFWFKHFYNNLKSVFGINIPEVKEIEQICSPAMNDAG